MDGAPCFFSGAFTLGASGLPSADRLADCLLVGNAKIQGDLSLFSLSRMGAGLALDIMHLPRDRANPPEPRRSQLSEFRGAAREMAGRVQEKVGELAGDANTQAEGLYNQAAGQAERQLARLSDIIKDQPIAAVVVAMAFGYLLGRLTS
jgi:uncharacterized protein YjbJ (UPF0337 family)